MNDTVATKAQDTLTSATSPELAVVMGTRTVEYHQGQRSYTAPKAGHMTAADQSDQTVENPLPRGRPHMTAALPLAAPPLSHGRAGAAASVFAS